MNNVVDLAAARVAKREAAEYQFRHALCMHLESLNEVMGIKVGGNTVGALIAATLEGLVEVMEGLPLKRAPEPHAGRLSDRSS